MDAFTRLPELKPPFFDLGLAWVTPVTWIHPATDRSTLVLEARRNLDVMVTLLRGQQILPDRFTLIERDRRRLCIHILFPEPGIYSLCLFAKAGQQAGALSQVAGLKLDADRGQGWEAGFTATKITPPVNSVFL
jgi:hypothetical protein